MTFSGEHQRRAGEGEREVYRRQIGRRFSLLCSRRKICALLWLCVSVCVVYVCVLGGWWCVFSFTQTDRGSMKINNVSVPPEVLNSGVQREEKKHNITF